jgi:hypothetical protein
MNMVVKKTDYFRGLIKGGNEDATFDWEIKKVEGMREKLLKEVKNYINVSGKEGLCISFRFGVDGRKLCTEGWVLWSEGGMARR